MAKQHPVSTYLTPCKKLVVLDYRNAKVGSAIQKVFPHEHQINLTAKDARELAFKLESLAHMILKTCADCNMPKDGCICFL